METLTLSRNLTQMRLIKIRGEKEIVLSDVVLSMNLWSEKRRSEREPRTERERRLALAGEEIRNMAVGRQASPEAEAENCSRTEEQESTPESSTRRRGRKRIFSFDSDQEEKGFLTKHVTARREMEERRVQLEEDQLHLERKKSLDWKNVYAETKKKSQKDFAMKKSAFPLK